MMFYNKSSLGLRWVAKTLLLLYTTIVAHFSSFVNTKPLVLVVGGLEGFVPEVELFEEVSTVLGGAATPRTTAGEGLLDFLEIVEETRGLGGEALRAIFFPLFDFIGSEGGGIVFRLVMEQQPGQAVVEKMRVIVGEVVGAVAPDS